MADDLYHDDILAWSRTQAELLRRLAAGERVNELDWAHVIEEVEDVGRVELKRVRSLFRIALVHALKVMAWPEHSAGRKWRNEIGAFLVEARSRYEPGMAQSLDVPGIYADALRQVGMLDMRTPPSPLPSICDLTATDLADPGFGPSELLARLRAAS